MKLETDNLMLTANQSYRVAIKLGFSDNLQTSKRLILKLIEAVSKNKLVEVARLESILLQILRLSPHNSLSQKWLVEMYPLVLNRKQFLRQ